VEHGEEAIGRPGVCREGAGIVQRDGDGLFQHHVLAGGERRAGHRVVQLVGRVDDDEVDGRVGEDGLKIRDAAGALGLAAVGAGAAQDGGEAKARLGGDQRSMEFAAGHAPGGEGDVDGHVCPLPVCERAV